MISRKKILFFLAPVFTALSLLAIPTSAVTISAVIPGMTTAAATSTSPGAFVSGFYNFALMIGGVLAFGAIVYGGVLYAASMGNPGRQSEGKEWVKSALLGLLLLAGAYLILYTINPNLVNLSLPTLQTVNVQAPSGVYGTGTSQDACSNVTCQPGSSPVNSQVYSGGGAQCSCQTPDTGSGRQVVCGGQDNGSCPSGQGCVQTQTSPVVWGCQALGAHCDTAHPTGYCNTGSCVRTDSGQPGTTPTYGCQ